jgi:hypothetical protein
MVARVVAFVRDVVPRRRNVLPLTGRGFLSSGFPELEEKDIRQTLAFAAENMSDSLIVRDHAA